jgi:hypothetical protein
MSCAFFGGIEWDSIYERRFDGPWIPDTSMFYHASKAQKASPVPGGTRDQDNFDGFNYNASKMDAPGGAGASKLPMDSRANGAAASQIIKTASSSIIPAAAVEGSTTTPTTATIANSLPPSSAATAVHQSVVDDGEEEGDEENGSDSDDAEAADEFREQLSGSGLMNMRDSVFALSVCNPENKLEGWSFMDEGVLASASGNNKKKNKRKKNKNTESASSSTAGSTRTLSEAMPSTSVIDK